jgi:hypothetical protein
LVLRYESDIGTGFLLAGLAAAISTAGEPGPGSAPHECALMTQIQ